MPKSVVVRGQGDLVRGGDGVWLRKKLTQNDHGFCIPLLCELVQKVNKVWCQYQVEAHPQYFQ